MHIMYNVTSAWFMVCIWFVCTCIIFQTKSKINIKQLWTNIAIKLLIDRTCYLISDYYFFYLEAIYRAV